jgi:putative oxidoreductase
MESFLGRFKPYFYSLLRIVSGLLFAVHGAQKLFGVVGGSGPVNLMSQMGLAGIIEFVGGLSIALGLFTSVWAFLASGQMAVAYFQAHAPRGFWPVQNGGEPAVLFCFVFLYIAAVGTGKWGLRAAGSAR